MSIWASTPGAEELTSPRLIRDLAWNNAGNEGVSPSTRAGCPRSQRVPRGQRRRNGG